ncbi:lysoplasmalogenase [Gallaecimonas sp. GXIMD4217]|uniref:lysoplasmalogenase n=1 Tax=Gallaecimonas sp. GXIMD4217 TaxID=3131927 RepID=UPI00311B1B79
MLLSSLALGGGLVHIGSCYRGPRWLFYVTKPGTMLVMLAMAWQLGALDSHYGQWLLAGLGLSLVGDVFLMLPKDRFIPGLVSFLLAHVCYVVAFAVDGLAFTPALLLLLGAAGAGVLALLWPHLRELKVPVSVYVLVILAMAWTAGERWLVQQNDGALLAFAGALVFMASDTTLALDKFRRPFPAAQAVIMATYFAAQWLLVLSLA